MKRLLALTVLLIGIVPSVNAASPALSGNSEADKVGEALKAKSKALSGKGTFGSLINTNVYINADGSYNQATIQKVKEAVWNLNKATLKNASKQLGANKEGLMYKNKLSAAVAEAEKIQEEMNKQEEQKQPEQGEEEQKQPEKGEEEQKQPEKGETPEKGEAEAEKVTTTWAFDAATGKYVEYANGVATGNTKDAVDNFSKETDTIQWAVDDEQVYVEHLTTKTIVIGEEEVTVYFRADGSIYALADDENVIKWKDADEQLKPAVEGALLKLEFENKNYKEYTENGVTIRVIYNDNNDITNVAIIQDGKWEVVQEWEKMSGSAKEDVLTHLEKYYGGQSEEPEVNYGDIVYQGKNIRITFDENGEPVSATNLDLADDAVNKTVPWMQVDPNTRKAWLNTLDPEKYPIYNYEFHGNTGTLSVTKNGVSQGEINYEARISNGFVVFEVDGKRVLTKYVYEYESDGNGFYKLKDDNGNVIGYEKDNTFYTENSYNSYLDTHTTFTYDLDKNQKVTVNLRGDLVEAKDLIYMDYDDGFSELMGEWLDPDTYVTVKEKLRSEQPTSSPTIELPEEIQSGGTTEEIPEEFGSEITIEDPTTNNSTNNATEYGSSEDEWTNNSGGAWVEYQGQLPN